MRRLGVIVAVAMASCAAQQRGPDVASAQRALAREMIAEREWARAFSLADAACRADPRDAQALLLRGIVYREQGLPTEAEADLNEALRLAPRLAAAHSAIAILHDVQGRATSALEHHRRAAELEPGNPRYLNNLGFSLFVHGRARDAIPVFHEALRGAPADERIRNNLGFAYAAAGDFVSAAEQFARGGSTAAAKNNLGWAYERRGALTQAFEQYVEAVRSDPGDRLARGNLERLARALGREVPADCTSAGS